MAQHACSTSNGNILKTNEKPNGNHHHCPAFLTLIFLRQESCLFIAFQCANATHLAEILCACSVEALSDTSEFEAGGDDHNAQQGERKSLEKVDEGIPQKNANTNLGQAENNNAASRASAEAILCRQAT